MKLVSLESIKQMDVRHSIQAYVGGCPADKVVTNSDRRKAVCQRQSEPIFCPLRNVAGNLEMRRDLHDLHWIDGVEDGLRISAKVERRNRFQKEICELGRALGTGYFKGCVDGVSSRGEPFLEPRLGARQLTSRHPK
jgi:hypothetical protein